MSYLRIKKILLLNLLQFYNAKYLDCNHLNITRILQSKATILQRESHMRLHVCVKPH